MGLKKLGLDTFRPHQEEVVKTVLAGQDSLLVMPTGAGKSLCYQLPPLILDGARAIVVSPLLSLIEDQVQKLEQQGVPCDRIHSGRTRQQSQEACKAWRESALKFLFIAPERLSVPGFIEFLEMNRPTLIAIDEAHCISSWGHDFRADYRKLGPRLRTLRPAPILALTATATELVRLDIAKQLEMTNPAIFVHGFRRHNLSLNAITCSMDSRKTLILDHLLVQNHRPAIVYCASRALAERTAIDLSGHFSTASFHAGLPHDEKDRVLTEFQAGTIDVVTATVAFGMGIDKANIRSVVHLSLPASLEGYYQEIGRAGRDGKQANCLLLHSKGDIRTLEFLFDKNYPEISSMKTILGKAIGIRMRDMQMDTTQFSAGSTDDDWKQAVEKLCLLDALNWNFQEDANDPAIVKGKNKKWESDYLALRQHKWSKLQDVLTFASTKICRMTHLVSFFGELTDVEPCGLCDCCLNTDVDSPTMRQTPILSAYEKELVKDLVLYLVSAKARTQGDVFRKIFETNGLTRKIMHDILDHLTDEKLITTRADSFVKSGEKVSFNWINLSQNGRMLAHQLYKAPTIEHQLRELETKTPVKRPKPRKRSRS